MPTTYGSWNRNLCQLGQETAAGTAVAGTTLWRGPFGGFNDERTREVIEEDIGTMASAERTYDGFYSIGVPMPETGLTFEQYLHVLAASMGKATPVGTGTYTYTYEVPTDDSTPDLQTYTLLLGNKLISSDIKAMPYSHVIDWEAKGEAGGNWTISANWRGARYTSGSFAAVALPTVEDAIFAKTKLYIDAMAGTIGTTQKSGVLLGASIKYTSNIEFVPVGDGSLYAVAHKMGKPGVSFTIRMELEQSSGTSIVATERGYMDSNTPRLIRLVTTGSGSKKITWDMAARYDSVGPYEKQGEQDTAVVFEGHCDFNSAADLFFSATVVNTLAALP